MRIFDNLLAVRILYLLVTPFEKTQAYKLGLISDQGEFLRRAKTPDEVNATSMLHRLVWRIKRFINMVPGGKSKIGSMVAAYALVRECLDRNNDSPTIATLVESSSRGSKYVLDITEDAPTNATGAATSTDQATVKLKKKPFKRFEVSKETIDGLQNGKTSGRRVTSMIKMESDDSPIWEFVINNTDAILVLEDETGRTKIVDYSTVGGKFTSARDIEISDLFNV